jgi:hypothetical protein
VSTDSRHPEPQFSRETVARNQTIRREINAAVRAGRDPERSAAPAFLCECGALGCNTVVEAAIDDYDKVRAHPARFVVDADHLIADVDTPVQPLPSGALVVETNVAAGDP